MFNFITLLGAEFQHYFDASTFRGAILIATLSFIGVLLICGIGIYFGKRSLFKRFGICAFILSILYSLTIGITCFVTELKDNADYNQGYQWMIAVFMIASAVLCAVFIFLLNKSKQKATDNGDAKQVKIINYSILATGVAAAIATIIVFVFAIIKNEQQIDALTSQSQILLAASIFLMLVTAFIFITISGKKKGDDTIALVYAAITVALSFALSYVRVLKMPFGGSITLASIAPIAVYSYMFGIKRGVLCCFIYGLMQSIQDPWIVHPMQYILDYPLAFACFGLAGIFKGKIKRPALAMAAGLGVCALLRFVCHLFSGAIFFGYAGEAYGMSPWVYSLAYNSTYVFADALISIIAAFALLSSKQVLIQMKNVEMRYMRNEKRTAVAPASVDSGNFDTQLLTEQTIDAEAADTAQKTTVDRNKAKKPNKAVPAADVAATTDKELKSDD